MNVKYALNYFLYSNIINLFINKNLKLSKNVDKYLKLSKNVDKSKLSILSAKSN